METFSPHVRPGALSVFQRHSRAVSVMSTVSMVTTMNESSVSSDDDKKPFIGESTLNTGREMEVSGPCHV